jgi:hypothetical protein
MFRRSCVVVRPVRVLHLTGSQKQNAIEIPIRLVSTELLEGDFTLVPTPREILNWIKEPS